MAKRKRTKRRPDANEMAARIVGTVTGPRRSSPRKKNKKQ